MSERDNKAWFTIPWSIAAPIFAVLLSLAVYGLVSIIEEGFR